MTLFIHIMPFSDNEEMYVVKRNKEKEIVSFDKILQRIKNTGAEVNIQINYTQLCLKVIDQLYDGIPTKKIDELTAEQCASMNTIHSNYGGRTRANWLSCPRFFFTGARWSNLSSLRAVWKTCRFDLFRHLVTCLCIRGLGYRAQYLAILRSRRGCCVGYCNQ